MINLKPELLKKSDSLWSINIASDTIQKQFQKQYPMKRFETFTIFNIHSTPSA